MKTLKQVQNECWLADVMTTEEFAGSVRSGYFISYDGFGYFHDGEKETTFEVMFDPDVILAFKSRYPYVCWYNK